MSLTADNLLDSSVCAKRAARPSAAEGPIAGVVRESCAEVVARGWMSGPYTMGKLDSHFGKGRWVSSPRFALLLSDKYRPIDDYSSSSINSEVPCVRTNYLNNLLSSSSLASLSSSSCERSWIALESQGGKDT